MRYGINEKLLCVIISIVLLFNTACPLVFFSSVQAAKEELVGEDLVQDDNSDAVLDEKNVFKEDGKSDVEASLDEGDIIIDEIFSDLKGVSQSVRKAITRLYQLGVVQGNGAGNFEPESLLTREIMAKLICVSFNFNDTQTVSEFTDIDANEWYGSYVFSLANANIVKGISDGTFGLGIDVDYQSLAVVLYRAACLEKVALTQQYTGFAAFENTDDYAKEAVAYLAGAGVYEVGKDPRWYVTKADAAKMLCNMLDIISNSNNDKPPQDKGGAVIDLEFGLPNKYAPITGDSVYKRFLKHVEELPDELPVIRPAEVKGAVQIFVSPDGNDGGQGTLENPFKTPKRALDALAEVDKSEGVVVYFRRGEYIIEEELYVSSEHSGVLSAPVFFSSYNGEQVTFIQGIKISAEKFKRVADFEVLKRLPQSVRKKVLEVDLADIGVDVDSLNITVRNRPQLIYNDNSMTMARYPNNSDVKIAGVVDKGYDGQKSTEYYDASRDRGFEVTVSDSKLFSWFNTGEIFMYGAFWEEWLKRQYRIEAIKPESKSVKSAYIITDNAGRMCPAQTTSSLSYYYFNVLEEIDLPGEWVLDKAGNKIYFYPPREDENADIYLLKGDPQPKIISDLSISDVNMMRMVSTSNIVINDIDFKYTPGQMITASNCNRILIQNCNFEYAYCAIVMGDRSCGAINCSFTSIVFTAVQISGSALGSIEAGAVPFLPMKNFLQNCFFYGSENCLRIFSTGCIISHNFFAYSSDCQMKVSPAAECVFEYNEFSGGPYNTSDAGVVYVAGEYTLLNRANHFRYNYFHHMQSTSKAIYFDDMSNFQFAYGNVIVSNMIGPVLIHSGSNNVITNNAFVNIGNGVSNINESPSWYLIRFDRYMNGMKNSLFYDNPNSGISKYVLNPERLLRYPTDEEYYYQKKELRGQYLNGNINPELDRYIRSPRHNVIKNNILYNTEINQASIKYSDEGEVAGNYFTQTDPGFVNFTGSDYSLAKDAVAYNNIPGLREIPYAKMGMVLADFVSIPERASGYYPADKSAGEIEPGEIYFLYDQVLGTANYTVTVATDPELKNVIGEATSVYTKCPVFVGEDNLTYYWKVRANINAKSLGKDYIDSPIYSFTTKMIGANNTEVEK